MQGALGVFRLTPKRDIFIILANFISENLLDTDPGGTRKTATLTRKHSGIPMYTSPIKLDGRYYSPSGRLKIYRRIILHTTRQQHDYTDCMWYAVGPYSPLFQHGPSYIEIV